MLNSRIRRLEHENERYRIRDLDMPLGMAHEQASDMLKAGMPIEMVIDRFGGRLPKNMLKDIVSNYERSKILNESN